MRPLATLLLLLSTTLGLAANAWTVNVCNRGEPLVSAILEELDLDEHECDAVPRGGRLGRLDLSGRGLTSLPTGAFAGFNLVSLDLSDNDLTELPDLVFERLNVDSLDLRHNRLSSVSPRAFKGSHIRDTLDSLYLSHNRLTSLPANLFSELTELNSLYLSHNRLTSLPTNLFSGLTELNSLYLSHNRLTVLPDSAFSGLVNLLDLRLHGNELRSLPDDLFNGLARLGLLNLGENHLFALPSKVFGGLSNLTWLYLDRNVLTDLPKNVFGGLSNLRSLRLSYNRLYSKRLPAGVFDGLTNLTWLDLRSNRLTSLDSNLFSVLGESASLLLGLNPLTEVAVMSLTGRFTVKMGQLLDEPPTVDVCERGDNQFRNAIAEATGSTNCARTPAWGDAGVLDLSGKGLTSLPADAFVGFDIHHLKLNSNALTVLPAGVFDSLDGLITLHVGNNQLATLPAGVFDKLPLLNKVLLGSNRFKVLRAGWFSELDSSTIVRMEGNSCAPSDPMPIPDTALAVVSHPVHVPAPVLDDMPSPSAEVPLMLSATESWREGVVRVINESASATTVRVRAIDDEGNVAAPVEVALGANGAVDFTSWDLENGNSAKGIEAGIGSPRGNWRLKLDAGTPIVVTAYVRVNDGFLTPMHDVLQRDDRGRLRASMFNPASETALVSRLRLINTGTNDERVTIEGVDDLGVSSAVTLDLAAGQSRTLSAHDLEEGAMGLNGYLGDRDGNWRLYIAAGDAVVAMSLLYNTQSGHISNLSAVGGQ